MEGCMLRTQIIAGTQGRRVLALGLGCVLVLAACGGSASPAPSGEPGTSSVPTQPPAASQEPTATEAPGASSAGGDGSAAFSAATDALDALDSYVFKVEIHTTNVTGSETTSSHSILSGEVINKPSAASSLDSQELDENGNVTSETAIIVIGSDAWVRDGDATQTWVAEPAIAADAMVQMMAGFRPEKIFGTYFAAIGANFSAVGSETKNGIQTTHYTGDQQVGALLGVIAQVQGTWTTDVWIANDGGYLVHSEASAQGSSGTDGGSFQLVVDISSVNSAPDITPPPTS
jgi:hypothetical protein